MITTISDGQPNGRLKSLSNLKNKEQTNLLIYDVGINSTSNNTQTTYYTSDTAYIDVSKNTSIESQIPLFFKYRDTIKIPNKVEYAIRKYLGNQLTYIHSDKEVAKELCLLLLAQLNSTNFDLEDNPDGWKRLQAKYLRDLIGVDGTAYKRIIEVLQTPLKKGQILEVSNDYKIGERSRNYRLGEHFRSKGICMHALTTKLAKNAYIDYQVRLLDQAIDNPICKNLFVFYKSIELPTMNEIEEEANRLIGTKFKTKKGKLLKRLNKHSKDYYADAAMCSFVEEGIAIFKYLTEHGLMVPTVGSERSGGRIVDSLTLMPSWIRNLIKIDGQKLVELDYKCLHPNIAISTYGGNHEFLTHNFIADELKIDVKMVKTEHLSFLNKTTHQMRESPIWDFYKAHLPEMIRAIEKEKLSSEFKYRITSRKLFKKEVEIMTEVIIRLNAQGIYVGYVYDALICTQKDAPTVAKIMNDVALALGVKTTVGGS
jgi:hypothetical protein